MKNNLQNEALDTQENYQTYIEDVLYIKPKTQKELQEGIDNTYKADLDYEQDLPTIEGWFNLIPQRAFFEEIVIRYISCRYPCTTREDIWKELPEGTFQAALTAMNNLFTSIQESADRNGYITYNLLDSRRRAIEVEKLKMEDKGFPRIEDIEGLQSLPF